jgi:putative membrane protein
MPTMGLERRLHPSSFLFSMGRHLRALLVPGIAVVFTAGSSGRDWEVWVMVLLIPYAIAAVLRSLSYRYRFDADELVVRKGWVFRSERHIPYARIQNIDAVQNVFHRMLGVADVRVETASGGEPEATMTVLPEAALAEMRDFVFRGRHGAVSAVVDDAAPQQPAADILLQLPTHEILLYGFIESRGAVLMGGAFGLLYEFGLFDRLLSAVTGGAFEGSGVVRQLFQAIVHERSLSLATAAWTAGALIVILLILRVLSMVWAFVRLHGFVLRRAGNDLRVDYGLLTRVSGTIPLQRIQTLTISESPLHRLFSRVSVHVDTAGGHGPEAQQTKREPIAPLVHRAALPALIGTLLPSVTLTNVSWQSVHPRAFRRALVRTLVMAIFGSILIISTLRSGPEFAVALLFLWAVVYARQYVAHLAWSFDGDALVFRRGWLWRRVTVARFSKIQVVSRNETPFDRRMDMASVTVDTAAASTGGRALAIPFLAAATASDLVATLSHHAARTAFRW